MQKTDYKVEFFETVAALEPSYRKLVSSKTAKDKPARGGIYLVDPVDKESGIGRHFWLQSPCTFIAIDGSEFSVKGYPLVYSSDAGNIHWYSGYPIISDVKTRKNTPKGEARDGAFVRTDLKKEKPFEIWTIPAFEKSNLEKYLDQTINYFKRKANFSTSMSAGKWWQDIPEDCDGVTLVVGDAAGGEKIPSEMRFVSGKEKGNETIKRVYEAVSSGLSPGEYGLPTSLVKRVLAMCKSVTKFSIVEPEEKESGVYLIIIKGDGGKKRILTRLAYCPPKDMENPFLSDAPAPEGGDYTGPIKNYRDKSKDQGNKMYSGEHKENKMELEDFEFGEEEKDNKELPFGDSENEQEEEQEEQEPEEQPEEEKSENPENEEEVPEDKKQDTDNKSSKGDSASSSKPEETRTPGKKALPQKPKTTQPNDTEESEDNDPDIVEMVTELIDSLKVCTKQARAVKKECKSLQKQVDNADKEVQKKWKELQAKVAKTLEAEL